MEYFITIIVALLAIVSQQQHNCAAIDVYFPSTSVKFNLPINEESESIFSKIPLAQFQVLRMDSNRLATDYLYSLEDNSLLRINSSSGEIYMRTDYSAPNSSTKYVVTAFPRDQPDHELLPVTHLTIEITPQSLEDYCSELEHICFWSSAQYNIAESQGQYKRRNSFEPVLIGALNSRAAKYLCPHVSLDYSLNAGSSQFVLKQNRLYTRQPLDHDEFYGLAAKTGQLLVEITCTVKLSTRDLRKFSRSFDIKLLDRNDNGPKLQESDATFKFYLDQPYFQADEEAGKKIIYVDKDTLAANANLVYAVHNDSNKILRPDCHAYEADHTGRPHTIVSCQLRFSRNGVFRETPYCVTLEARDLTVESHVDAMSATAYICYHINLSNLHETDQELPQALPLRSRQHRIFENENFNEDSGGRSLSPLSVEYEKDVSVYRTAASYYRIVQPGSFLELMRSRSIRFDLVEDKSGAFGITTTSGIVYVKNPKALEEAPETIYFLNVTWSDQQRLSHVRVINVHLVHGRPENSSCELKIKSRSQTCAQVKLQTQCNRFCGLATGGGSCEWRGSNSAMFSTKYGSCVPEAHYCPDHVCDPLEELNPMACPQDCIPANRIMGPHSSNENKKGIYSASGTCICEDNGKCSCAPLDEEPKVKKPRKKKNETEAEALLEGRRAPPSDQSLQDPLLLGVINVAGFECDRSCMFFVISCPLVFVLLLLFLLIAQRKMLKRRLGKQSVTPSDKQALPEFGDGDLALMPLQGGFKFESGDAKWEFPRDKLQLDTVLGEGEFGQVLKGYATDIAGLPGITTVAVKTLKKGANSVEYMALLSEFQLLQEVSHPNVIKLLGACTSSEAPLLIIEYARYGSLRSYLRLSRKIECAGVDFADGVEPVNVKMVLTFAWQICKGMAYLTELKLVHRDLAARNVLLADGKICKISDFGLTRDVYEDDAYLKRSRDRVPVKWMAPESLADHVYTSKSDVWSFGVLCWELITLGASPYPGIPPQNLWSLLKTGYRMDRPENCSEAVYSIVRTCWADEPNARPSFKFLAAEFEKLLGNNAKYIDLETNAVSNPLYCGDDSALMTTEFGEPESLQHLWSPPKIAYDIHDQGTSYDQSEEEVPVTSMAPPGYDLPRPLIDANAKEQVLRYENDLRFPLNIRKSSCTPSYSNMTSGSPAATALPHYSVPVKRGHSYLDMTNKSLIPDNLDSREFEKHLSKTISFRFSSLLNLKETPEANQSQQAEDVV
ncbi:proto-oncogene tyrosine-protein kinase receptor Ret [Drosophila ficusphila]|uniref:proto-oncogene tyrosine-protein kinase receptor Ret n=1 Tax=Drosophila ficusphila TaxID=30025 RepID=UPI001C893208|nr:proto-oncogene tyrosine-protein kinase receptor Ret [Drosophila ficusphila]XP_017043911.2 proto-oncogene tyrosine-protein kinase receptor Ret [Drosophila ficusphila]XP_017043913.2 proto-oncogene tyrosine-protein kinase receptor Ret [Drosophila ficusphila]